MQTLNPKINVDYLGCNFVIFIKLKCTIGTKGVKISNKTGFKKQQNPPLFLRNYECLLRTILITNFT